jgi:MFS family permease
VAGIRRRLTAAASAFEHGSSAGVLLAIALRWLVTLGMRFLMPAILPRIKDTFAMSNAEAGFAVTVIWACYALMQFPAGVLIDRVGERRLLTASLVLAGVSVGLLGGAPTVPVLLVACAAFGIGTGLYGPARGTALSKVFAPSPGRAFGMVLAAGSVGSAALPFVGGVAASSVGWRATLTILAVPFVGLAAFAWWSVPDLWPDPGASRASVRAIPGANREVVAAVLSLKLMLFVF